MFLSSPKLHVRIKYKAQLLFFSHMLVEYVQTDHSLIEMIFLLNVTCNIHREKHSEMWLQSKNVKNYLFQVLRFKITTTPC